MLDLDESVERSEVLDATLTTIRSLYGRLARGEARSPNMTQQFLVGDRLLVVSLVVPKEALCSIET